MTDAQLTYTVELDVSGGSFGSAFTATDVTSKAAAGFNFEPVSVTWGRQDQYGDVNPTSVSGCLLNSDGTFSPGNSGSTYYPHIKRGLRRRVSVGVNATTVHVSEDYATAIEVIPAHDAPAVTSIDGADILARFGQATTAQSGSALSIGTTLRTFLAEEMLVDSPTCLYMMQEADGATSFGDVTGTCTTGTVQNSKYGPGIVAAGTLLSGFYGGTVVAVTNSTYGTWTSGATAGSYLGLNSPDLSGVTSYTIEIWVQTTTTAPGANGAVIAAAVDPTGTPAVYSLPWVFLLHSDGTLTFSTDSAHGTGSATSSASILDGLLHQIVVVISGTSLTLYIDGASAGTGTLTGAVAGPVAAPVALGMRNAGGVFDFPFSGAFAYFAEYPSALSSARVAAHYNAGATAFAGERTDQRITRLLSYRANTGSSLDTGLGTMGVQDIAGRTLQECLLEVGQVEAGAVFVDGTGRVNFRSRSRLFNPTPTVTLDLSVGGVEFGSNWREDTQNVLNDATVANTTTGSEERYYDASSITADGEFSTSLSLPLNSDSDALNMAGWLVANGTQQQLTATPLIVNLLHLTAAQAQAVLQLQPLDCLQLTNCPTPAPASTMTFIVQGGTTSLAADAASVTLNLTPLPYPVGVWDSTVWDAAGVTWAF